MRWMVLAMVFLVDGGAGTAMADEACNVLVVVSSSVGACYHYDPKAPVDVGARVFLGNPNAAGAIVEHGASQTVVCVFTVLVHPCLVGPG